ncbi:MAG: hypothetical protein WHS65_01390 [Melioribacteraceae bacterium]
MDNLIEIIITFFVIYSILNMIAGGKKEKDKSKFPEEEDHLNSSSESYRYRKQKSDGEITIEDLFGIKIPETEYESSETKSKENISLENLSWNPEKEFEEKIKQREALEHRNIAKEIPDIDYDKTPTYEIAAVRRVDKQDVQVYEEQKSFENQLKNIKTKLKDPKTVRELFIITEILNKPKSLRR